MKIRSVLLAGLLVAGFVYLTSVADWKPLAPAEVRLRDRPPLVRARARPHRRDLSTDEVNNIDIYKMANQATVNISTVVYRRELVLRRRSGGRHRLRLPDRRRTDAS